MLFAGIGAPEHFGAEGGKEVALGGFDDAYLEGGAADFYCGVLRAAEAVSIDRYKETVAAAGYIQTDGLSGGEHQRTHGETVRSYGGEADHIGAWGYDRTAYAK